jgi:hypothetical protein
MKWKEPKSLKLLGPESFSDSSIMRRKGSLLDTLLLFTWTSFFLSTLSILIRFHPKAHIAQSCVFQE